MRCWDENFYVDETIREVKIPKDKHNRKITLIGAGIGIKNDDVELIDWCGIAFYYVKNNGKKNGNGYWSILGKKCLEMIVEQTKKYKPEKIYICNQIAFYTLKSICYLNLNSSYVKNLIKKMKPVTQTDYRGNGIYKTKQKVGRLVKKNLGVEISTEDFEKILKGKLFDLKTGELFNLRF